MVGLASRSFGATLLCVATLTSGCRQFGFSDRVLWRVEAPGGHLVAVCREVPEFDGPSYSLWLETPDGEHVGQAKSFGDADPCNEIVWSPDGRVLAVLVGHVARVHFASVDAGETRSGLGGWQQVTLSTEARLHRARALRFVEPRAVELSVCASEPRAGCLAPESAIRFDVPTSKDAG